MGNKYHSSDVTARAWHLLRLALLWGRKGGVFRRRLLMELRLVPKYMKSLCHHHSTTTTPSGGRIYYLERELSFDETPIIGFKNHRSATAAFSKRFHIPCMSAPRVDFEYDFDDDDGEGSYDEINEEYRGGEIVKYEEQGIDERAEEFISNFYQEMKLQRQISHLQHYNEIPPKRIEY